MSLLRLPISLLALIYHAAAQVNTPATFPAAASTTVTASLNTTTEKWPVATLFMPIDVPTGLAASVITAAPDRTAYAIGCLDHYSIPDTDNDCDFGTSFVLTEGVSTLIYTLTYAQSNTADANGATIHCGLEGGTRATAATCVFKSVIDGLGTVGSTSVLASTQLSYAPVTITAGAGKLMKATPGATDPQSSSSSTGAAAARVTGEPDVRWRVGGLAAGVLGLMVAL